MTERIYYRDSYAREFEASVRSVEASEDGCAIELDQTCFYPTSGGQPHDVGSLNSSAVLDVRDEKGTVLHFVRDHSFRPGELVRGRIDWERRFDHMQQHTGQHILSQAFLQHLQAETRSFHLGAESCTVDLSCPELTLEAIYGAEDLANRVIFENHPIRVHFVESDKQREIPLRKLSQREGKLRIVEISDFDWSACGGTHCRSTGEVGLIKIRRWERVKQQARVEFFCGWRALRDYRWKNRAAYKISQFLSCLDREIVQGVEQELQQQKELRSLIRRLQDDLVETEAKLLSLTGSERNGMEIVQKAYEERDVKQVARLARRLVADASHRIVVLAVRKPRPTLILSRSQDLDFDLRQWGALAAPLIEGRGGGTPQFVQLGGSRVEGLSGATRAVLEQLAEYSNH